MLWYRNFGITEIVFIAVFAAFYVFYMIRIIRIAKRLKTSYGNIFIKFVFRSLYFALFIIALLGPSFGGSKKEVKSVGKDIMLFIFTIHVRLTCFFFCAVNARNFSGINDKQRRQY